MTEAEQLMAALLVAMAQNVALEKQIEELRGRIAKMLARQEELGRQISENINQQLV